VKFVDPDGRDYYRHDETGSVVWRNCSDKNVTIGNDVYENIGKSYSERLADGSYVNYYQNIAISASKNAVNAEQLVLDSRILSGRLLRRNSRLSPNLQQLLMADLVRNAQNRFASEGFRFTGDRLEKGGNIILIGGNIVSATGIGFEIGQSIAGIGNCMIYIGAGFNVMADALEGNKGRALYKASTTFVMDRIGASARKYVTPKENAIFNLILVPYNTVLGLGY